jgi:hypothetical protein
MNYRIAEDAKPQLMLLLIATIITIALWFIPLANYLVYPIRLFATFIHEGGHVVAALLTGASVQSLSVASDGSGMVQSQTTSWISALVTSSAGYLGTTAFGVALLFLIRRSVSSKLILQCCAIFIAAMTLLFGFFAPLWNFFSAEVHFGGMIFTMISGAVLSVGLFALARYASLSVARFAVAFIAVQCLINSALDLATLLLINSPLIGSHVHSDAANMAAVTGLPALVWVLIWIGISVLMISVGLRIYAATARRASGVNY